MTEAVSEIRKLHNAGMTVARINFSHGDYPQYRKMIANIKADMLDGGNIVRAFRVWMSAHFETCPDCRAWWADVKGAKP